VTTPRQMCWSKSPLQAPLPRILCALTLLATSGCTVGPKYHTPTAEIPSAYKEVGDWKPAQPNDENLGGDWWEIFQPTSDAAQYTSPASTP
jgi:hypothetical protein